MLKIPCIRVTEQGEIKLTLIWKLHSYWLALLCWKAPYVLAEEKANYKYPPVNYHNWPDKMFTLCTSTMNAVGITNHFFGGDIRLSV